MSEISTGLPDAIANAVIAKFTALPQRSKPQSHGGRPQWVPLSGITIIKGSANVSCLSLGTGMKCLPAAKVQGTKGYVLHDWHAEILAIRAFNHYLLHECSRMVACPGHDSLLLRYTKASEKFDAGIDQPFTFCDDVKIHMYCSEPPCGDASMELVMKAQADDTPWAISENVPDTDVYVTRSFSACSSGSGLFGSTSSNRKLILFTSRRSNLKGHESFSELGIVRRKPARGDSLPTLSKSCSDKIALKQCVSLLNSVTSTLISPNNAYISTLVMPRSKSVPWACNRAFGPDGRMAPVATKSWPGGYGYHALQVCATDIEFPFSRHTVGVSDEPPKGSNISTIWTSDIQETLINGVLQGRKQLDPKGASVVSRKSMWDLAFRVLAQIEKIAPSKTDRRVQKVLDDRRRVKGEVIVEALKGWIRNHDDGFMRPSVMTGDSSHVHD